MADRRPSLREQWFIEDALRDLNGLCPVCRGAAEKEILLFGPSLNHALSEIYSASRRIRVRAGLDGRDCRHMTDWEAAIVMRSIAGLTAMSVAAYGFSPASEGHSNG